MAGLGAPLAGDEGEGDDAPGVGEHGDGHGGGEEDESAEQGHLRQVGEQGAEGQQGDERAQAAAHVADDDLVHALREHLLDRPGRVGAGVGAGLDHAVEPGLKLREHGWGGLPPDEAPLANDHVGVEAEGSHGVDHPHRAFPGVLLEPEGQAEDDVHGQGDHGNGEG